MATTTNFGWETPDDTDLVKDGAAAMRTLGNSIDTSFVDLKGGTTGQVLSKASGTDLDFTWVAQDDSNAIQNAIVDAKGDLIAATAADTPARLAVGTNGQILTVDSAEATGLKWVTPATSSSAVVQVKSAVNQTNATTTSTTFQDYVSVTITPTSASNKIYVLATFTGTNDNTAGYDTGMGARLVRTSTSLTTTGSYWYSGGLGGQRIINGGIFSISYMDSPATTSATTYKLQYKTDGGTAACDEATIIVMEVTP